MKEGVCKDVFEDYVKNCTDPLYKPLFSALLLDRYDFENFMASDLVAKAYPSDKVIRKFVRHVVDRLLEEGRYEQLVEFLSPLSTMVRDDCYLKSILALSYVRIGKIESAKGILQQIESCESPWYKIALNALEDSRLQERIKNVGQNR
jgi:hypothetical protein